MIHAGRVVGELNRDGSSGLKNNEGCLLKNKRH